MLISGVTVSATTNALLTNMTIRNVSGISKTNTYFPVLIFSPPVASSPSCESCIDVSGIPTAGLVATSSSVVLNSMPFSLAKSMIY